MLLNVSPCLVTWLKIRGENVFSYFCQSAEKDPTLSVCAGWLLFYTSDTTVLTVCAPAAWFLFSSVKAYWRLTLFPGQPNLQISSRPWLWHISCLLTLCVCTWMLSSSCITCPWCFSQHLICVTAKTPQRIYLVFLDAVIVWILLIITGHM